MSQTVFITGTSSGIGEASARRFAQAGWNVVATMRHPEEAGNITRPAQMLVTRLDVEDRDSIGQAVSVARERFGRIDVLVNNAGYGQYGLFEAVSPEKIQQQFEVNVFGMMDVTRAVLPQMRLQGSGVLVNVSSGAGVFTLPMMSLYSASKFALEGFSEALSYELASQNIAVKIVEPHGGVTSTRFSERAAEGAAADPALADYEAFVERTNAAFARMTAARRMDADEVAEVIFQAATDGTDRLRYPVGDDSRGFLRARREMTDDDYIAFMRAQFAR